MSGSGLDNPFVNSQGQTNIFPVTFDQNAPFSLNGPFLSLSNDMASTHVDQWNVTVERQITPTWFASVGYVGSRTRNIWESTPLNNASFVTLNGVAPSTANTNARRPFTLQDPANGKYYGPVDLYVTDGKQRYSGMIASVRRVSARTSMAANYTLSHCYGSPDGFGGSTTNVSAGYNQPGNPGYDDGNCAADRLQNFTLTASVESPRFNGRALNAVASGWRLVGSFRGQGIGLGLFLLGEDQGLLLEALLKGEGQAHGAGQAREGQADIHRSQPSLRWNQTPDIRRRMPATSTPALADY